MPIDLLEGIEEFAPNQKSKRKPVDLLEGIDLVTEKQNKPKSSESYGESLLYALPRIGKDVGQGIAGAIEQAPNVGRQAMDYLNPANFSASTLPNNIKAALAGGIQGGMGLRELPYNALQYLSQRLHLIPESQKYEALAIPQQEREFAQAAISDLMQGVGKESILPQTLARNALGIQGGSGIANALGRGVSEIPSSVASRLLKTNLGPQELSENLRVSRGTQTPMGDVLQNARLKKIYENVLQELPGSGVERQLQNTASLLKEKGNAVLDKFGKLEEGVDLDQHLASNLQAAHKNQMQIKNSLYNEFNDLSKELGVETELPSFANAAKKHAQAIADTNVLKYEPEMQGILRKIAPYETPVKGKTFNESVILDDSGRPIVTESAQKNVSLREANLLKGKMNDLSNEYGKSPNPEDRHRAKVFGDLARSLKNDIQASIEKHPELKSAYERAETNYKENYSPYLNNEFYKYATGKTDPETLVQNIIKTGKSSDRGGLIQRFTDLLPEGQKNLLGLAYVRRALDSSGNLDPNKLRTLLSKNSIGDKQFNALFPDKAVRNALKDYTRLSDMNKEATNRMLNLMTGQRTGSLIGGLVGGGTALAPVGAASSLLVGRAAAKALTSPKVREKVVGKIIKRQTKKGAK